MIKMHNLLNNSIFKVTFAGICPSLAYVGSINDYIDRKLWLKPRLAFNYQTLQSCIISSFLKAVGSGKAGQFLQTAIMRNCIVFSKNCVIFLEIVICRKWPISAILDHEKLYSFS